MLGNKMLLPRETHSKTLLEENLGGSWKELLADILVGFFGEEALLCNSCGTLL